MLRIKYLIEFIYIFILYFLENWIESHNVDVQKPFIAVNNLFINFYSKLVVACPVNPILQIDYFIMHEIDYRSPSNYLHFMARNWILWIYIKYKI